MRVITPLSDRHYFAELTPLIDATVAGDRITLATMNFTAEEAVVVAVLQAAARAARRGVDVCVTVDAHDFLLTSPGDGPLLCSNQLRRDKPFLEHKYTLLEAVATAGGKYAIINQPRQLLALRVAGRSHIKTAVVNDRVFLGGCNLGFTDQTDTMVQFTDAHVADWLHDLIRQAQTAGSMRTAMQDADQTLVVDEHTTIYVDAGKPRQSIILAQALQCIDQADEYIFITCQFFPNSATAAHLARAVKRGVRVEVAYNHPGLQTPLFAAIQKVVLWGEHIRLPKVLFAHRLPAQNRRLHAKILATEKAAMIGSHNYVPLGVNLGTAEIALLRQDAAFSKALVDDIRPRLVEAPAI